MATPNVTNGNGRVWQVAFWVLGFFCYIWLIGLTNGVVANDRIRQDCDRRIETRIDEVKYKIYDKLIVMDKQLSRIEAKLEK